MVGIFLKERAINEGFDAYEIHGFKDNPPLIQFESAGAQAFVQATDGFYDRYFSFINQEKPVNPKWETNLIYRNNAGVVRDDPDDRIIPELKFTQKTPAKLLSGTSVPELDAMLEFNYGSEAAFIGDAYKFCRDYYETNYNAQQYEYCASSGEQQGYNNSYDPWEPYGNPSIYMIEMTCAQVGTFATAAPPCSGASDLTQFSLNTSMFSGTTFTFKFKYTVPFVNYQTSSNSINIVKP